MQSHFPVDPWASDDSLRFILDRAPVGVTVTDSHGRFVRVNGRFAQILGRAEHEIVGRPVADFSHPDDVAVAHARRQQLDCGELSTTQYERRFIRKSGEVIWCKTHLNAVRRADGALDYVVGLVEDITRQKEDEQRLRFDARLLECVQQAVVATALDGRIMFWNRHAQSLFGWSAEEACGTELATLIPAFATLLGAPGLEKWSGTLEVQARDGRRLWITIMNSPLRETDGSLSGVAGVWQDVTERRRSEDQLRKSEAQLAYAQSIASIGSWEYDFRTGERMWSDEVYRIYGLESEKGKEADISVTDALVHPQDLPRLLEARRIALEGRRSTEFEYRIVLSDGTVKHLRNEAHVEFAEDGSAVRVFGIVEDVTEAKLDEENIRRRASADTAAARLGQAALAGVELDVLFSDAAAVCAEVLGGDMCGVWKSLDTECLLVGGYGWADDQVGMLRVQIADSWFKQALTAGATVRDSGDGDVPGEVSAGRKANRIAVAVPGEQRGVWGMLTVQRRGTRRAESNDIAFVRSIAVILGQAIQRRSVEVELHIRAIQQSAIAELGQRSFSELDGGLLDLACELVRRGLRCEYSLLLQMTPDGEHVLYRAGERWLDEAPEPVPIGESQAGWTIQQRVPIIVDDYEHELRFRVDTFLRGGLRSGITVPIMSADRIFGVLTAQSSKPKRFGPPDVHFMQALANVLADGLARREDKGALIASERQFRTVVEGAAEIIFTLSEDGVITSLNPAFEAITGRRTEDWIGRHFLPLVPLDEQKRVTQLSADVVSGQSVQTVVSVESVDGRRIFLDATVFAKSQANQTGIYGFARDVTRTREAEQERDRVTNHLRLLLESTDEGIFAIDSDGCCTLMNRSAETLLGLRAGDVVGRNLHDLVHHSTASGHSFSTADCPILQTLVTKATRRVQHEVFWRNDGSSFPVEYAAAPIEADGEIVGLVVTFRDITSRLQLEAQLQQAQRVTSLGRLAATMAHEFNNVLMGISPFVDILRRHDVSREQVRASVEHMSGAVRRGKRVTEEILRFTQTAEPTITPIAIADWLYGLEVESRTLLGPAYALHVDFPTEPLTIRGDASQLHQILMNLVINARDAMPGGGAIRIAACRNEKGTQLPFGVVPQIERFVHITIADEGCGISESALAHIFEPLYTTKKNGTGLGLPLTHQILKRHDGEIFVQSTVGSGTTFHLFIPAAEDQHAVAESPAATDAVPAAMKIVLVEDDEIVGAGLAALLQLEGFETDLVTSGAATMPAIESAAPHAVILDIGLPDVDGVTVYRDIALRWPKLPVVFSTGHGDEAKLERFLSAPHVAFLQKPYDLRVLREVLHRITRKAVA